MALKPAGLSKNELSRRTAKIKIILSLLFAVTIVVIFFTFRGSPGDQDNEVNWSTSVRIDMVNFVGEAPLIVALNRGIFERHGLTLQVDENASGADSIARLLKGEIDFATAADTAVVQAAFTHPELAILAATTHSNDMHGILARRDHGIQSAADLPGKKIGIDIGTASEYLLDQFVQTNQLRSSDLVLIDGQSEFLIEDLLAGRVDAIVAWEPSLAIAKQALGDNHVSLSTDGLKNMDWFILSRKDFLSSHPDIAEKLLRSAQVGISYINENPHDARRILSESLAIDENILELIWSVYDYELQFTQSMLNNLEKQAKWMKSAGRFESVNMPDFMSVADLQILAKINPDAIKLENPDSDVSN